MQGIRRAIRTAVRLIDDLLELARAESGQLNIRCEMTDVSQAAEEVVQDFHAQATSAGLALQVTAPPGLLADTDPARCARSSPTCCPTASSTHRTAR